jgi:acetamidase/formamidase
MTRHDVPGPVHRLWTPAHEPVLEVQDGDTVAFSLTEASGGQFSRDSTVDDVKNFDWDRVYPLAGPIIIKDAEVGDCVEVEFVHFEHLYWGWTVILPGMGLLSDDFPDAHLHLFEFSGDEADFLGIARIPLRPFCGVVGLCPQTSQPLSVLPPGHFGGNMDCRDLTAGSKLYLPVQVPGGRLSIGDPHAAQGDGELCVSAIESSLSGEARVRLHKGMHISAPQFFVPGPIRCGIEDAGYHATMGAAPDLMAAARDATRAMIDWLGRNYGLSARDAYVLCSVVADLRITELVDMPNWIVSLYFPISVMK